MLTETGAPLAAGLLSTGPSIIAIPTMYVGSEVTPVWGLTDAARKTTGTDPRVRPRTVIYDPECNSRPLAHLSHVFHFP